MSISKNQLKLITSLSQKKYRQKHKLFVAEGVKVVNELLNSSFELAPKNVLIALHYAEALVAIGNKERAEIILAPYMQRSDELDREIERLLNSKY